MVQTVATADRFRVGPASELGSRAVTDGVRREIWWVYPTFLREQRLSGHEDGMWYFRPMGNCGNFPVSLGYPSFEAALEALRATQEFKDLSSDEAKRTPRPH